MYCPECGSEAGDANYCPECGTDLSPVRAAREAKAAKSAGKGAGSGSKAAKAGAEHGALGPQSKDAKQGSSRGPSAALIWGVIAVVVVAVVALVVFWPDGSEGTADADASYSELVAKANDLYDQGDVAFNANDIEGGSQLFAQAAELYALAWAKQPGDPNVGTDWATALFYSGDMEGAVEKIAVVLEENPDFQTGWFNKGNYLAHEARITDQMGDAKAAKKLFAEARKAYLKTVALDPESEVGKEADARLEDIPE
jgi:hypothetical protein